MNNPFLDHLATAAAAPLPSSFPLPPSPQPSILELVEPSSSKAMFPTNETNEVVDLPPSPPASEPSSLPAPPSPSKMALPPSPPESPTLEQGPSSADPTSVPPPLASPSSDDTVPSPVPLTPTAIESTPLLASSPQQEATPLAIPSEPVLVNNQSVQLPSDATDSLLLSSTSKPLLRKKKSFLGLGINSKRDLSVSAPAAESSSLRSSKGTGAKEVKKKTSLMGGLLRSLTGKSGTKKVKPSSEQGLLTRGLSVIEDRSEKARVEKEELKQDEAANAEKIKNHVATLLVPASTRPLSGAAPSPSSTLRGQSQSTNARSSSSSPARIGVSTLDEVSLEHPGIKPSETPRNLSGGPNQRFSSQPPPPRSPPTVQNNTVSSKPKLNVSVPAYNPPSSSSSSPSPPRPLVVASNPIPIQNPNKPSKVATTYARNSSGSSSGSEEDSDDEDVGLTIKKKPTGARVAQQVEVEEDEDEIDEDGKLSSLGHGNSPVTPGLPATPPDSVLQEQAAAGFGSFFGSVRGRKQGGGGGGGRPLTMHFGKASTSPQFNHQPQPQYQQQQHHQQQQQQQQQQHYQSYNQKQENRQSRIPVSPVMHTAAEVAAKIQAAEGEDQKNAEAFFM